MNPTIYEMVVRNSDVYPAAHFRSGLLLTGIISTILYFLPFTMGDPILLLYVQAGAFLLGYLLAYGKKWKRFFTTNKEMREEVYQRALECFYEYGLNSKNNSVLVFASVLERRIEFIPTGDIEESKLKEISEIIKNNKKEFRAKKPDLAMKELVKTLSPASPPQEQELIESQRQAAPSSDNITPPTSHQTSEE